MASLMLITLLVRWRPAPGGASIPPVPKPEIILEVTDIPQTRQPLSVKGQPIRPIIPIKSDLPDQLLIDETDVIFGTEEGLLEIPAPPVLPGRDKTEYHPPRLMVSKFPEYPRELQKKGIGGVVVLSIRVDTEGMVVEHRIKQNTTNNEELTRLAVETVYKCRFFPASDGKKTIPAWTEHKFEFTDNQR